MKTIKILSIALFFALLISSCDWHNSDTVIGSGDVESMEVMVPEFTGVSVTGTCDVDIQIGETQYVQFSAQSQVLDVMTYKVRNGILEIGFEHGVSVNTRKDISARIVIPELSYIAVTGSGDFDLNGEKQEILDIYITGSGNVNAFGMEVDNCGIRISGAGNCKVFVTNSLDVQVSGVGNIFYQGTPSLSSEISGVGNVTGVNR